MTRRSATPFFATSLAVTLLACAPAAHAFEGLNLAWDHCHGEGTGVQNANFACDVNTGAHVMVGSFVLGTPATDVSALDIFLDLAVANAFLPPWWEFLREGSCRRFAAATSFQQDPTDVICVDWAQAQAGGAMIGYFPGYGEATARIQVVSAVTLSLVQDLSPGIEYFAFNLRINHTNTVGAGSCDLCAAPACIVFSSCVVGLAFEDPDRSISAPASPGSNAITWQGGGLPALRGAVGCPASTPVHRSTWGQVKSQFR